MTTFPNPPFTLQELNLLLGTISVVLLLFSEILSSRYRAVAIRISKDRLRKVALVSTMAFLATLVITMLFTFWYP